MVKREVGRFALQSADSLRRSLSAGAPTPPVQQMNDRQFEATYCKLDTTRYKSH